MFAPSLALLLIIVLTLIIHIWLLLIYRQTALVEGIPVRFSRRAIL